MRYEVHHEDTISRVDQPGTLQWGLFVTHSYSSRYGRSHLWLRPVYRTGSGTPILKYSWTHSPVPSQIYKEACDQLRSIFDEYLIAELGVESEPPF